MAAFSSKDYPDYTSDGKYKVIGTRPIRHDGVDKVTGAAVYGADVRLPGLLYGKVLRSPHPHAEIISIDTSKALALDGVRAVATADDLVDTVDKLSHLGETMVNVREIAKNSLASDKVLYTGHAVAAVCAVSPHIAEEALDLIEVEYKVLEPVVDVREAMRDDAPLLDEERTTRALGENTGKKSNIATHNQHAMGDLEAGFAEADVVVEREFHTATIHQGYIEPHNTTVWWKKDGSVTVWVSTQGPFEIRSQVSEVLNVPVSKVKVIPCEIGGGFGGKFPTYMEPAAAIMSHKTGQPVKMIMSRTEVFQGTGPAPGSYMKIKMGPKTTAPLPRPTATWRTRPGPIPARPWGPERSASSRHITSPTSPSTRTMWSSTSPSPRLTVRLGHPTRPLPRRASSTSWPRKSAWTRWRCGCRTPPNRGRAALTARCTGRSAARKPCKRPRTRSTTTASSKALTGGAAWPVAFGSTAAACLRPPLRSTTTARLT